MSLQICDDGHRCRNGSMCTRNPNDEGSYYCDCDEGKDDEAFAGIECEHTATSYCTFSGEVSHASFCTNGGQCTVKTGDPVNGLHVACDCQNGYEGDHCQFIKNSGQSRFYENTLARTAPVPQNPSTGGSGGIVAVVVLLFLGVIGGLGFFVYRKKKTFSTPLDNNKVTGGAGLTLEADGGVLQESIKSSENMNGSNHHVPPVAAADAEEGDVLEEGNVVNGAGDDIDPKEMEDIQISNSNEII
mmetsp:Transcript_13498/g.19906  ORF Transcript_13498/g.19906 Transcript_13498/m.19906 type:complete len:244 (-) Transcript_13498:95-826(-)